MQFRKILKNESMFFFRVVTTLDSINGWSIQTLLRGENVSKQSVDIQANDYHVRNRLGKKEIKHYEYKDLNFIRNT